MLTKTLQCDHRHHHHHHPSPYMGNSINYEVSISCGLCRRSQGLIDNFVVFCVCPRLRCYYIKVLATTSDDKNKDARKSQPFWILGFWEALYQSKRLWTHFPGQPTFNMFSYMYVGKQGCFVEIYFVDLSVAMPGAWACLVFSVFISW